MALLDLRLQHFRSYTDDSFEFDPGVNIIVGPNASGKTNLLEAILVLSTGKSYRAKDSELVQFNQPWARLEAHTDREDRTLKLQKVEEALSKSFIIDDQSLSRLTLARTWPVVVFEPNHLLLLGGAPELRRAFIDQLLEQTIPTYANTLKQYRRVLLQRNRLLKQRPANLTNQLFAWNVRLSDLGGLIVKERKTLLSKLNEQAGELYSRIAGTPSTVELEYGSNVASENYSSHLLKQLEKHLELDTIRGFTGHGPHREDIKISLNGAVLQETASRGETRSLLLVLKMQELLLLEEVREQKPLLLLDDVFSELDGSRRRALTDFLAGYQTFITTTDADVVVQHFMGTCTIIPLGS